MTAVKAAPFAYVRPGTIDDALAELGRDGAKVLAGGQSLVPVLAMRLGRPATLVDINAVAELDTLSRSNGDLRVGATVRQRTRAARRRAAARCPAAAGAALGRPPGDPQPRHRLRQHRPRRPVGRAARRRRLPRTPHDGRRPGGRAARCPPADFFTGAMTTVIEPDELLTEVRFPVAQAGRGVRVRRVRPPPRRLRPRRRRRARAHGRRRPVPRPGSPASASPTTRSPADVTAPAPLGADRALRTDESDLRRRWPTRRRHRRRRGRHRRGRARPARRTAAS